MKSGKPAVVFFLFVFMISGIAVSVGQGAGNSGGALKVGSTAPDFTVGMTDGSSVSLSSLRGRPVLLHFWATWCAPCVRELPLIAEAASKYSGELAVLPVCIADSASEVSSYLEKRGETFRSFVSGVDKDFSAALLYQVHGIPHTIFIDGDGVITEIQTGAYSKASLENSIKKALGK